MPIKLWKNGTMALLEKLGNIKDGSRLTKLDIKEIVSHPDIISWLCTYENAVPDAKQNFERVLSLLHSKEPLDLNPWAEGINFGLRKVLGNLDDMKSTLLYLNEYDWAPSVWNALKYLPENTKLNVKIVLTIDGLNAAMFSGNTAFLSLVFLRRGLLKGDFFSHELHHIGVDYWWRRNLLIQNYQNSEDHSEFWLLELLKYLVSEGIAGVFCNPSVRGYLVNRSDIIQEKNPFIMSYDLHSIEMFDHLEDLLNAILEDDLEKTRSLFDKLSNESNLNTLPPGQFLSARMVWMMNRSPKVSREQIVGLVKTPWLFFQLYNEAARDLGSRQINDEIMKSTDKLIERMKVSGIWTCG